MFIMLELDEEGVAVDGHAWILFLLETVMVILLTNQLQNSITGRFVNITRSIDTELPLQKSIIILTVYTSNQ